MGVVVTAGQNIGGSEANVTVSVQNASGNEIVSGGQEQFLMKPLSQVTDEIYVADVATFMETVNPSGAFNEHVLEVNREYPVVVRAGDQSKQFSVKLTVDNLVEALESESPTLMKSIVFHLMETDWDKRGDKRFTNSSNSDSLVEQLLAKSRGLSRSKRAVLQDAAKEFKGELPACNWLVWCKSSTKASKQAMEELLENF